jgi:hypothetical protein
MAPSCPNGILAPFISIKMMMVPITSSAPQPSHNNIGLQASIAGQFSRPVFAKTKDGNTQLLLQTELDNTGG